MTTQSNQDEFPAKTRDVLAKRAGFLCSICKILTIGGSDESVNSVTNIGVAAHITAASPGGRRYDSSVTKLMRSGISNPIRYS